MHSSAAVVEVLQLREQGLGARRIARRTGLPPSTVRDWAAGKLPRSFRTSQGGVACSRCGADEHRFDLLSSAYVYLLGLYLGDGTISAGRRHVYRLRIFLDKRYPGIVAECEAAMSAVLPRSVASRQLRSCNCYEVHSYSKSWPCLFPQHGPGKKHLRSILLTDWQKDLVRQAPKLFLRGLIHSDGHRFINTGRGGWVCPRYAFTNYSADIRAIFCEACELLSLHWTASGRHTIYVSRKADVAKLDRFVGPKR